MSGIRLLLYSVVENKIVWIKVLVSSQWYTCNLSEIDDVLYNGKVL